MYLCFHLQYIFISASHGSFGHSFSAWHFSWHLWLQFLRFLLHFCPQPSSIAPLSIYCWWLWHILVHLWPHFISSWHMCPQLGNFSPHFIFSSLTFLQIHSFETPSVHGKHSPGWHCWPHECPQSSCTFGHFLVQYGLSPHLTGGCNTVIPHGHAIGWLLKTAHGSHWPIWQKAIHLCFPHDSCLPQFCKQIWSPSLSFSLKVTGHQVFWHLCFLQLLSLLHFLLHINSFSLNSFALVSVFSPYKIMLSIW